MWQRWIAEESNKECKWNGFLPLGGLQPKVNKSFHEPVRAGAGRRSQIDGRAAFVPINILRGFTATTVIDKGRIYCWFCAAHCGRSDADVKLGQLEFLYLFYTSTSICFAIAASASQVNSAYLRCHRAAPGPTLKRRAFQSIL